ncbi:MAG TPA: NUDIX domain-containing protein [Thermoanaerobaculia bacterium]|jgi:A/G-specific adenine glycosylase|nr:NUDIX domain-containing protein [Thermoanaerobaculia bacterium]
MLQQTTVAAVAARYDAFIARFPDVASLARAREESVLAAWSGLGYYARARHLHRAAREIVARHAGRIPSDPVVLRELPGFGDYIAGAVASIAFGIRAPAAEANVTRVIARLFRVGDPPGKARERRVLELAGALLPDDRPGDATAAWMDLGQQICLPRRPRCLACPVARWCEAREAGEPERYPVRRPRPETRDVHLAAGVARRADGRVLVVRANGSLLSRLWRFPSAEADRPDDARSALAEELAGYGLGLEMSGEGVLGEARHAIMNRRISVRVYAVDAAEATAATKGPAPQGAAGTAAVAGTARAGTAAVAGTAVDLRWMTPGELERAAIPTLTRRIAAAAGLGRPRASRPD